jgi:S1-C subfamily serine protease
VDGQEASFFEDDDTYRLPLPPEDRLWRHPSEVQLVTPSRPHRWSRAGNVMMLVLTGAVVLVVLTRQGGPTMPRASVAGVVELPRLLVPNTATMPVTTAALTTIVSPPSTRTVASATGVPARMTLPRLRHGTLAPIDALPYRSQFLVASMPAAPSATGWTAELADGSTRQLRLVAFVAQAEIAVFASDRATTSGPELGESDLEPGETLVVGSATGLVTAERLPASADGKALEQAVMVAVVGAHDGDVAWHNGSVVGFVVHAEDQRAAVISTDLALAAADMAIEGRAGTLAWLGVSARTTAGSVEITGVTAGSPAASIGLRRGDVLLKLGGHAIGSTEGLVRVIWQSGAQETVPVEVRRGDEVITLQCKLGGLPADA